MARLAASLVPSDVTTVLLSLTPAGELGVATRGRGQDPEPISRETFLDYLARAGWQGGPVQIWAPNVVGPRWNALRAQVESFADSAADALPVEIWIPGEDVGQEIVDGRIRVVGGAGHWVSRSVGEPPPATVPRGKVVMGKWLVTKDGFLTLRPQSQVVRWHGGAVNVTLPEYLDLRPGLPRLAERDAHIFEYRSPRRDGFSRMTSTQIGTHLTILGWTRQDVRIWMPNLSENTRLKLTQFAVKYSLEVVVLRPDDVTSLDANGDVRAVAPDGGAGSFRVLGPLVERGISSWEPTNGLLRLRPGRGNLALPVRGGVVVATRRRDFITDPIFTADRPGRSHAFEVTGLTGRTNASGNPEFVVRRLDGSLRWISSDQMADFLGEYVWQPGVAIAVPMILENGARDLWALAGAAMGAFVFEPAPDTTSISDDGSLTLSAGPDDASIPGRWVAAYTPPGQTPPVVSDLIGRLAPPDSVTWLRVGTMGLSSPTAALLAKRGGTRYPFPDYPEIGVFALELEVRPDGRLLVGLANGTVRPADPPEVVDEARAVAGTGRFGFVMLWSPAPADADAYATFLNDVAALAHAFNLSVMTVKRGVDPADTWPNGPSGPNPAPASNADTVFVDPPGTLPPPGRYLISGPGNQLVGTGDTIRGVHGFQNETLLFGMHTVSDEVWTNRIHEIIRDLAAMPRTADRLPLLVMHVSGDRLSWLPDRLLEITDEQIKNVLEMSFGSFDELEQWNPEIPLAGPIRIIPSHPAVNRAVLEGQAQRIASRAQAPVYVGHRARFDEDLLDYVADDWVPVTADGLAGSFRPGHVRDSHTGQLIPVGEPLNAPGVTVPSHSGAGEPIGQPRFALLTDDQGVYGIDLRSQPRPGEPPLPAVGRQPGAFLVVADGSRNNIFMSYHGIRESRSVAPGALAPVLRPHLEPDTPVYLVVGALAPVPVPNAPRITYATVLRAELGQRHPVFLYARLHPGREVAGGAGRAFGASDAADG
jgi:hypothetical protein